MMVKALAVRMITADGIIKNENTPTAEDPAN
jgi:hypothetical protein